MSEGDAAPAPMRTAEVQTRRPYQVIWLIPVVAALVALFLGWQALSERGPTITLLFLTADGLQAGQTKVRHKAVDLGTVEAIRLSDDLARVSVRVRMRREATRHLTERARFWVVRPRLGAGNISGLDTLLSGAYIELDPGTAGGEPQRAFVGLEVPPAVRSDEPGRTFQLTADRVGSVSSGSLVLFRDIVAGEVLDFSLGPDGEGVTFHVFVREPYDRFVREGTHFWNASGIALELGPRGVGLRLASLMALLSGGVAFDTPPAARGTPVSPTNASFRLYPDQDAAAAGGFQRRIPLLARISGSVRGLAAGSPVEVLGIQVGVVTEVTLDPYSGSGEPTASVRFELQPARMVGDSGLPQGSPQDVGRAMVARGLQVQLQTVSYLTGQVAVALTFSADPAGPIQMEGGVVVVPSIAGGIDGLVAEVGAVIQKLNRLPFDEIARNLNQTLLAARDVAGSAELRQALRSVAAAMASVDDLARKLDANAGPALQRLPEIAKSLQAAVDRAGRLVASADAGYGENSAFRRDVQRLLGQVSDTARSLRLLADYLDQHPEALLRGRGGDR